MNKAILLTACILALTVVLSGPLPAADTALHEDAWLLDSGMHPCLVRQPPCSDFLRQIFDGIIEAREQGDEQALKRWQKQLYWHYVSSPEDRPAGD